MDIIKTDAEGIKSIINEAYTTKNRQPTYPDNFIGHDILANQASQENIRKFEKDDRDNLPPRVKKALKRLG